MTTTSLESITCLIVFASMLIPLNLCVLPRPVSYRFFVVLHGRSVCTEAGMFAIRSRRKSISEKDFLDAVQKVRVNFVAWVYTARPSPCFTVVCPCVGRSSRATRSSPRPQSTWCTTRPNPTPPLPDRKPNIHVYLATTATTKTTTSHTTTATLLKLPPQSVSCLLPPVCNEARGGPASDSGLRAPQGKKTLLQ